GCLAPQDFDLKVGAINLGECTHEVNPIVTLTNSGTTTTITSAELLFGIEGEDSQSYSWTGSLEPHASVDVVLPLIAFEQEGNFLVEITSVNETIDDNLLNNSKTVRKILGNIYLGNAVTISLTTDDYGDETSWELVNGTTGVVAAS